MTIERDSVLNKIRALLAKTMENGCSEAEAMAALGKAQAMKDAYAVTEGELNLTKEEKAILRREPPGTKDPHRIKWFLTAAVSKFCNCRCWRERRAKGGGLVFCGLPSDAQFATWLLDTLAAFVQAEIVNFLMEAEPSNEERPRRSEALSLDAVIGSAIVLWSCASNPRPSPRRTRRRLWWSRMRPLKPS
jgi:hypothetical protein